MKIHQKISPSLWTTDSLDSNPVDRGVVWIISSMQFSYENTALMQIKYAICHTGNMKSLLLLCLKETKS